MQAFKVPVACTAQREFVTPQQAQKGQEYFCLVCNEPLIFRRGEVYAPHFAHRASSYCSEETVVHMTAKLFIRQAVQRWKAGVGEAPKVRRKCQGCGSVLEQSLPDKVHRAALEVKLPEGYVVDVALMSEDKPIAAVEIRVAHKVDDTKASGLPIPFIEVDGHAILRNRTLWEPLLDRFHPVTCKRCKDILRNYKTKAMKIAEKTGVQLPTGYYRYGLCTCWKCGKEILVFTWPQHRLCPEVPPRQQPIPRTLKYVYSKTARKKYWANTCGYCGALQGDFFLHCDLGGPFVALDSTRSTTDSFDRDLLSVALYAEGSR